MRLSREDICYGIGLAIICWPTLVLWEPQGWTETIWKGILIGGASSLCGELLVTLSRLLARKQDRDDTPGEQ